MVKIDKSSAAARKKKTTNEACVRRPAKIDGQNQRIRLRSGRIRPSRVIRRAHQGGPDRQESRNLILDIGASLQGKQRRLCSDSSEDPPTTVQLGHVEIPHGEHKTRQAGRQAGRHRRWLRRRTAGQSVGRQAD